MTESWFHVRPLDHGVTLVAEPVHVNSFVVEGAERALLVDTGLGIGTISDPVRDLTDRPVTVVNSHFHFDHCWGNGHFNDVRIHSRGVPMLEAPVRHELLEAYSAFTKRMLEDYATYERIDRTFFHLTTGLPMPRQLSEDFDPDRWAPVRAADVTPLEDGDVIDLGDRQFTVIHTPGHSFDSICLLEERTGVLFAGDTINTGPLYTQFEESDLVEFRDSTRRLAALVDQISVVYVAHFVRYAAPPSLITATAHAFQELLEGKASLEDSVDLLGSPVKEARYDGFSIMIVQEQLEEAMQRS